MLFVNQLVIYICAGLVKLGVALVLLRLVTKRGLRLILYGSMAAVVAWTVVMTLYASYFCASSGSSNWAGSTTCATVGFVRTGSNIFIDYFCEYTPMSCTQALSFSCDERGMGICEVPWRYMANVS